MGVLVIVVIMMCRRVMKSLVCKFILVGEGEFFLEYLLS